MSEVAQSIDHCISSFADDVRHLLRQAVVESVEQALGAAAAAPSVGRAGADRSGAGRAAPGLGSGLGSVSRLAPHESGVGRRGGKRTREEIESTAARLLDYVGRSPGRRIEEISAEIAISSRELQLPVRKLLQEGRLRTEGQKRATRYYPARR